MIGIDPSRKMIERARQKRIAGNVVFRRVSAEALPLEDCSVDLVFLSQVYHHLTDPGGSRAGMFPRPAVGDICASATPPARTISSIGISFRCRN